MAKRARIRCAIRFEYTFDRLLATKLEQAYEILNPDQVRILRTGADVMRVGDEGRCNLRPGIVGQAEGGAHDRQSDGGAESLRPGAAVRRAGGMGFRGRRL